MRPIETAASKATKASATRRLTYAVRPAALDIAARGHELPATHYWSPPAGYYQRWVGPSPNDVTRSDQEIQADIIDQLTYDTWPDFSEVYVAVQDGVVTLTGTVSLATEKWWAKMDAWQTAGVKDVHNRLRIGRA